MAIAEEQKEKKEPFSPLQTGCAFVMLTNMIIYLVVVAFVFNMLDPSKLDVSYLTKRGFTVREEESEEDKEFRELARQKKKEQEKFQKQQAATASRIHKQDSSPAVKLSELSDLPHVSSRIQQDKPPHAARTPSLLKGYGGGTKTAKSRQYTISIYPQATLHKSHSTTLPRGQIVTPQHYDTVAVELAPGINYPVFRIPAPKDAGKSIYSPPNPVPDPTSGGLKITAPSQGAEPIQTNRTGNVEKEDKSETSKDTL